MEDGVSSAAAVLPGASQPTFCRSSAADRRMRKSGSANIFQGMKLHQLRRLFHMAGEPDAEQKAKQVWRSWRRAEGDQEDGDRGEVSSEEEEAEGLAQALVGLRVRARNRGGIRAETNRGRRGFGHNRTTERTPCEEVKHDSAADVAAQGPNGGQAKSCDPGSEEGSRTPRSQDEKDPERYLHRIRH